MKKLTYVLMILAFGISTKSFSQNPFESLGAKDIKVLTFSNGKYNEFFDNDSIVQIGSVLFNTKSNEIVAFVQTDTTYSEATLKPEITSRWLSPDPLASKFPFISPYAYANNNPIKFIDVNGLYPKEILSFNESSNTYKFTTTAAHLLSLVSGVDQKQIMNTAVQSRAPGQYRPFYSANEGGGAITLGTQDYKTITLTENWFEDDKSKYNGNGYGQDINAWLRISSHEVGHLPQIDKEGGLFGYLAEFAKQYTQAGSHDGAPYENEADNGYNAFNGFNDYVNKNFGDESLYRLFKNSDMSDKDKTAKMDSWFNSYKESLTPKDDTAPPSTK